MTALVVERLGNQIEPAVVSEGMRKILVSLGALATLVVVGCAGTSTQASDAVARTPERSEIAAPSAGDATSMAFASSDASVPTTTPTAVNAPVAGLMASPGGFPLAVQVYGGVPPRPAKVTE